MNSEINHTIKNKTIRYNSNITFNKSLIDKKYNLTNNFIMKLIYCKKYMGEYSCGWIVDYIFDNVDLITISKKFLSTYYKRWGNKDNVCYEIFETFILYKNNIEIDYKIAIYLSNSVGIIGTHWYYDVDINFKIIFLTVKDIINELDGDGYFTWLEKMSRKKNIIKKKF